VWGVGKIKLRANSSFVTIAVQVYRDGVEIPWDESGAFELKPGSNRLGIYVTQIMPDGKFKYVDFHYVTVNFGGLALNPAVQDGEPNKPLTFNAILSNPLPAGYKIEWWADGALKKSGTEMSFSVSFATAGTYDITVRMVDSSGKTVLEDTGTVIIKAATTTTTTTKPATMATTTRPPTSVPTTTSSTPTVTTGDTYNYAGALAAWMADEAARIASTRETTPTYVYTARLEWVVTPYIKDGNVMGASKIISTKTYPAGGSDTWVSSETFSAQNPGAYMTLAQLRAKYPQFAK
jgi:hypothetical protein